MDKRTIHLFTDTYPLGWAEPFLEQEIKALADKFAQIIIYPLYPEAGIRKVPSNVTVEKPLLSFNPKHRMSLLLRGTLNLAPFFFAIKEFNDRQVWRNSKRLWIFFTYLLTFRAIFRNGKRLRHIARSMKRDEICYFYWGDKSVMALHYMKRFNHNFPFTVVKFHGSDLFEEAKGFLPFRSFIFPNIDLAICTTEYSIKYLTSRYPSHQPKSTLLNRLGTSYHAYNRIEPSESFNIASCSNIIELKRVDIIAKAIMDVAQNHTEQNFTWTHFGDGSEKERIIGLCAQHPKNLNITFAGRVPNEEIMQYYAHHRIDLFLHASRSEGACIVVMEALSFGIPVISTNVGGIPELITPKEGELLPIDLKPEQMAQAIDRHLALTKEEKEAKEKAARAQWERLCNADIHYRKLAEILHEKRH